MHNSTRLLASIFLTLGLVFNLYAQQFQLTITVNNSQNSPISGAVVFVNDSLETITDQSGTVNYNLPAGSYTIYSYAPDYLDHVSHISLEDQEKDIAIVHRDAVFWSTAPTNPPIGVGEVNGVRLASAGGLVYLHSAYGGEPGSSSHSAIPFFYQYDPQTDQWTELPNAPHFGLYGISAARGKTLQGGDAIYIIRGYWTGQRTWFARYDIGNGVWQTGLNHQIPWRTDLGNQYSGTNFQNYPRNGSVMVWDEQDHIYLFPGSGYGYEKYDWYRYSISTNSWQDMGELPHKQGPGNAAILVKADDQDYLYVQFGLTPHGSYTEAEFWRYSIAESEWEKLADHDYGADDGSMLAWDGDNYIYHTPGAYAEQSWDKGLSQKRKMMRYSIEGDYWSHMEAAPYNVWGGWDDGGGIVMAGGHIYGLKGGSDVYWAENGNLSGGGGSPSNKFWKFTPHSNTSDLIIEPSEGNGKTYPSPGRYTYLEGSDADLLAVPDQGWSFKHWVVNGQEFSTSNAINFTVEGDASIKAVFVPFGSSVGHIDKGKVSIYAASNRIFFNSDVYFNALTVYDTAGRNVASFNLSSEGSFEFELKVPQGVYIVTASGSDREFSSKLVVH